MVQERQGRAGDGTAPKAQGGVPTEAPRGAPRAPDVSRVAKTKITIRLSGSWWLELSQRLCNVRTQIRPERTAAGKTLRRSRQLPEVWLRSW